MKKYLIIIFSIIFYSCDFDVKETIDKAVVQEKFYNEPGFKTRESFVLLIKYKDFCFHRYVSSNIYGNYKTGDSINIIIHDEYINGKLKGRYYRIYE